MALKKLMWVALAVMSFTACGTQTPQPTQTPVVEIIPGDTPPIATVESLPEPTANVDEESIFPTPFICEAGVVEQPFENGRMFWVGRSTLERCKTEHSFIPGTGQVWVALFDESGTEGEWLIFVDSWDSDLEPASDPAFTPPSEDLLQPERGFGKVWRTRLTEDQREQLGWATAPEFPHITTYRYDAGGFVNDEGDYVVRPGQHTLTSLGGEMFFFDEQDQTFDYIPAE